MEHILIKQNSANSWTLFSLLASLALLIISGISVALNWPIQKEFSSILPLIVFLGSATASTIYGRWLAFPRDSVFLISEDIVLIEDQPFLRWKKRSFATDSITAIVHDPELGSFLKTSDGKSHFISSVLMMRKKEIFDAISKSHPHIKIVNENIPNQSSHTTPASAPR